PSFNPLIIHVADAGAARRLAWFNATALLLSRAFWPGPMTLILPVRPGMLSRLALAGNPTVALRVPAHPTARALLAETAAPIAAPSANPSGRVSPTRSTHVVEGLPGMIDAVIDGGACPVGIESTILLPEAGRVLLLRPGGLTEEDVRRITDLPVVRHTPDAPNAPGQLTSHYAPAAPVRRNAVMARDGELLVGFGPVKGEISLSPTGDLVEAAASLFDVLRRADVTGRPIAVAPVPNHGLGLAINDRLRRAAAPR
ncbi:MAG: L-threonylcarbamoyladenylate synthase, partial [Pseudomonadota bacterium]